MASGQPQLFSGGGHTANLILSTGLLQQAWSSLSEHHNNLMEIDNQLEATFTIKTLTSPIKATVIAFSGPTTTPLEAKLEPLDASHPLAFLRTSGNKKICIHQPILPIFSGLPENSQLHDKLIESLGKESPQLILVGQGLGGSIADLFTIWALKNRHPLCPVPICITFGAPFVGNEGLRRAIAKNDRWLVQFWHVVAHDDVFSRLFLVPKLSSTSLMPLIPNCPDEFKPFGTYFMLSDSGCTCVTDPEYIVQYMELSMPPQLLVIDILDQDYGALLHKLLLNIMFMQAFQPTPTAASSALATDLELQLNASGVHADNPRVSQSAVTAIEDKQKEADDKRKDNADAGKRLNDAKKNMVQFEWYKKKCEENHMDMYDSYKLRKEKQDIDAGKMRVALNKYWGDFIAQSENTPQTPDVPLRTRWLFGGTNYRRMVEPLEIAEYYRKRNAQNYFNDAKDGRKHQFAMLEEWEREDRKKKKGKVTKKTKAPSLTEDSTFWAHVEEAVLDLDAFKEGKTNRGDEPELMEKLMKFEAYVMNLIFNFMVSATIFFEKSTFMTWWNDYKNILEGSYTTDFTKYMSENQYTKYK